MKSALLSRIWPHLLGATTVAVLALVLWVWRIDSLRASYKSQLAATQAEYAAFQTRIIDRTAEAVRLDRARNAQVAARQAAITQEKSNAFLKSRDAELARVHERLRAVPAQAYPGSGGAAGMPTLPALSAGPVRPGAAAIVDVADAEACTVNTLNLESLIAAWSGVAAIATE